MVENAKVLTDLVSQKPLAERGFRFAHVEGPDKRGIDCALLYNPALFTVRDVKLVPYVPEGSMPEDYITRGFLTVSGTLAGEHVAIVVCHWPSRFAGSYYREVAGRQVRALKDSLLMDDPECKVMVMGDMNDDPMNKSMSEMLSAKADPDKTGEGDMYNPWYNILKQGLLHAQILEKPDFLAPVSLPDRGQIQGSAQAYHGGRNMARRILRPSSGGRIPC